MPTSPSHASAALVLSSPDALVAGLPYLLGFEPKHSAVILWLCEGQLLLSQRIDLPKDASTLHGWVQAIWSHTAAAEADEIVAVLIDGGASVARTSEALRRRADAARIGVRDLLAVDDRRWRSLMCTDPGCCDPRGRSVDARTATRVAAEFASAGVAPLPDRACLEMSFERDVERSDEVRRLVELLPVGGDVDEWRDAGIEHCNAVLLRDGHRTSSSDIARALQALSDVRVRDTLLWECVQLAPDTLRNALDRLIAAVRSAPPGMTAPIATVTAIAAWLLGDGARALIAVDRALEDCDDYSLALLVEASLQRGLPPASWRRAMVDLTRDQCRYGT